MIRIALIVFGFIAITLTLILMQPSTPGMTPDKASADKTDPNAVSRAETALDDMSATAHSPAQNPALVARATPSSTEQATEPATQSTRNKADALPEKRSPETLETLIIGALKQGQNPAYIDALVNDAAERGRVDVPGQLVTADGRVDTSTLLKILSKSPDAMRAGGTLYTVAPGDSLAAISFRFYGTTERVTEIVNANVAALAGGGLTVGQDLVIPPK